MRPPDFKWNFVKTQYIPLRDNQCVLNETRRPPSSGWLYNLGYRVRLHWGQDHVDTAQAHVGVLSSVLLPGKFARSTEKTWWRRRIFRHNKWSVIKIVFNSSINYLEFYSIFWKTISDHGGPVCSFHCTVVSADATITSEHCVHGSASPWVFHNTRVFQQNFSWV